MHRKSPTASSEGTNSYSTGTILCSDPTSNSDVRICNFIFWDNLESNVRDKVWNVISNLGVVVMDKKKDYSKRIVELEVEDKAIFNGKNAIKNGAA